jgi:hypothetical protein
VMRFVISREAMLLVEVIWRLLGWLVVTEGAECDVRRRSSPGFKRRI